MSSVAATSKSSTCCPTSCSVRLIDKRLYQWVGAAIVWLLLMLPPASAQQGAIDPRQLGDAQLPLWPEEPPGWTTQEQEVDTTDDESGRTVAGRRVMRLGHVSNPMITVFRAPEANNTGAAIIVCPGGGYNILAYDLEGTEVCQWLQSIGVTGILLKYRVPRPPSRRIPDEPLIDAQRAMSLVRSHADQWHIDPQRIGILGFSAGGNLAARLATNFDQRLYPPVDAADEVSCRPSFAVLVYPAYLYEKESEELLAPQIRVSERTPPMFLTMAFDDRVGPENVLRMGLALKQYEIPCEIHLYHEGGHGYGLRRTKHFATTWPDRCAEWMKSMQFLRPEDVEAR